jgi:hypothetical protein
MTKPTTGDDMNTNTDRSQLEALAAAPRQGRPPKGGATREGRVNCRVEQWVRDTIDADRQAGESLADVLTRWARERTQ